MKRVQSTVKYMPRSAPAVRPDMKAVIFGNEKIVYNNKKIFTYTDGVVGGCVFTENSATATVNDYIVLATGLNNAADMAANSGLGTNLTIKTQKNAADTENTIYKGLVTGGTKNIGVAITNNLLKMYKFGFMTPISGWSIINVADHGKLIIHGASLVDGYDNYLVLDNGASYVIGKIKGGIVPAAIPDGDYYPKNMGLYADTYGVMSNSNVPFNVTITINEDYHPSTTSPTGGNIVEITNKSDISDLYGTDAMETPGNIAYSAAQFFDMSGGAKTFYLAPMNAADDATDIATLLEKLKLYSDAYFYVYDRETASEDLTTFATLMAHIMTMSGPTYKRERRLYVKEVVDSVVEEVLDAQIANIMSTALRADSGRISVIADIADTNSFLRYCARRYAVADGYSLTNEPMDIGNIWPITSLISDTDKETMKSSGVVMFNQSSPRSIPYVMYQTTSYQAQDIVELKEEDVQISIDMVSKAIRTQLAPRIAKGDNNKIAEDPLHPQSVAYMALLNADLSETRRLYVEEKELFSALGVVAILVDPGDPRHVMLGLNLSALNPVNRVDVYIYI